MKKCMYFIIACLGVIGIVNADFTIYRNGEHEETKEYAPFVDAVRIRATPDLNGKSIATLEFPNSVEFIIDSTHETVVDYNGEKMKSRWMKVSQYNTDEKGWIWKGFMVRLRMYQTDNARFYIPDTSKSSVMSLEIIQGKSQLETKPRDTVRVTKENDDTIYTYSISWINGNSIPEYFNMSVRSDKLFTDQEMITRFNALVKKGDTSAAWEYLENASKSASLTFRGLQWYGYLRVLKHAMTEQINN